MMTCSQCGADVNKDNVHLVSVARQGRLEAKIPTCSQACAKTIVVTHQHPDRVFLVSGPEFVTVAP